jgi:uncharacterized protein
MKRLEKEKSAYLQHAAKQNIDWYPWSEEAFERAQREDKPVFLSSGAIWCHWCHVMAKESFMDDEVAQLLNEFFVAVKLDRDERPDIDRRYQRALAIMGLGGGWPLSIFLTPDRKPFYGGTYFPPNEGFGRPGFKTILKSIGQIYKEKKGEVSEHSQKFFEHLKEAVLVPGDLKGSMLNEAEKDILDNFDKLHGGFGSAPKFPMSGALEFLMARFSSSKDTNVAKVVKKTLLSMAQGGIHDHLAGGFHRYSTDREWLIPHFEKMADDNAWLLLNYVHASRLFEDAHSKEVSEGIIHFLMNELAYPDGGFFSSQDADVTPDDEGGYFTWTDEDFKKVLSDEEYRVLSLYLLHEKGAMHHDPAKKVLHVTEEIGDIARKTGLDENLVQRLFEVGKTKLLMEREKRVKPFIDKAMYTSINGMLISAFFEAYKVLKDEEIKEFALKSLDKVFGLNFADGTLFHCPGIRALLDDHVNIVAALISAHEATGDPSYLSRAEALMKACIDKFWDSDKGGFFDTEEPVLGTRLRMVEDIPHPSGNSVGIMNLIKLGRTLKKEEYLAHAEKGLKYFAGVVEGMGLHGGYYFCALDAFFHETE